jgi:hypothetical protein
MLGAERVERTTPSLSPARSLRFDLIIIKLDCRVTDCQAGGVHVIIGKTPISKLPVRALLPNGLGK